MDASTILMSIALVLIVLAFVLRPFLTIGGDQADRAKPGSLDALHDRAGLLAERNRIYAAINTLDFDHSTNKVADQDYVQQRHDLMAQGVAVLKQIDALPPLGETPVSDPVEAAIVALRHGAAVPAAAASQPQKPKGKRQPKAQAQQQARFCPHCGKPVVRGDRFCGSCGAHL